MISGIDQDTYYWSLVRKLGKRIKLPFPYATPKFGETREGKANRKMVDELIAGEKKK